MSSSAAPRLNFASDNVSGVAPEIMQALLAANEGQRASYGADDLSVSLDAQFSTLFEREVTVIPVATGTASNCLALASITPQWGAVYASEMAHIVLDEANAPEFYTGGAKFIGLPVDDGKLTADQLTRLLPGGKGIVHHAQPAAISVTQSTECGTVYTIEEIEALVAVAHRYDMAVHMDGARFANALVHLGCTPAQLSWKAGIDVLSLGATKNGALAAEAIILFDPGRAADMPFRRKRAGHLFSKHRFLSAQLSAYIAGDLWLRHARTANDMAQRLVQALAALPGVTPRYPVQANEIFLDMDDRLIEGLTAAGYQFLIWGPEKDPSRPGKCIRLVTAYDTTTDDVDKLADTARGLAQ